MIRRWLRAGAGAFWRWRRFWFGVLTAVTVAAWWAWRTVPAWYGAVAAKRLPHANRWGAWLDREGRLLRLFPDAWGEFGQPMRLADLPDSMRLALLAAEDWRFAQHCGFDWRALLRATWQNLTHRRVISGASTITQQVVRLLDPRPRTLANKLRELLAAVHLERIHSKEAILETYVNLVPMGHNLRGLKLAARVYFDREVAELDLAQTATLAALPRSPGRLSPGRRRGGERLLQARNRVLDRLCEVGAIEADTARAAQTKPLGTRRRQLPGAAAHFADWLTATRGAPTQPTPTSLDLSMQASVETVLGAHRLRLFRRGAQQAAVVVLDTRTREVRAMAGSLQYSTRYGGFNNGCLARRSAGSVLKPFLYALALEQGYTMASPIPDTRQSFATPHGDYLPYNANRRSYGPVNLRVALGNSLNIAAVRLLAAIGTRPFFALLEKLRLVRAGDPNAEHFGLGLAVGNLEISALDLAAAYAALADRGRWRPPVVLPGEPVTSCDTGLSPAACWIVLSILADPTARMLTFGNPRYFDFDGPLPIKTGTSNRYRDAWIVTTTPALTIVVWVGNFEGRPASALAGSNACGPILRELVEALLPVRERRLPPRPHELTEIETCAVSGARFGERCPRPSRAWFLPGSEPEADCPFHPLSAAPPADDPMCAGSDREIETGLAMRFGLGSPRAAERSGTAGFTTTDTADRVSVPSLPDHDEDPDTGTPYHHMGPAYADWLFQRQFTLPGDVFRLGNRQWGSLQPPDELLANGSVASPGVVRLPARATDPPLAASDASSTPEAAGTAVGSSTQIGARHAPVASEPSITETPAAPGSPPGPVDSIHAGQAAAIRPATDATPEPLAAHPPAAGPHRRPTDQPPGEAPDTPTASPPRPPRLIVAAGGEDGAVAGSIRIVSPHDHDRIVTSPGLPNRVLLRAIPDRLIPEVMWLIDGIEVARTPPPYEIWWEPVSGLHRITALGPATEADEVTITVE